MALGADAVEDLAAAARIAVLVERGLVALQDLLALFGWLLEQRPREGADLGVVVHDEIALLAEVEAPGLDVAGAKRGYEEPRPTRIREQGVRGLAPQGPAEAPPARKEERADIVALQPREPRDRRGLDLVGLPRVEEALEEVLARRGIEDGQEAQGIGPSNRG